MGGVSAMEHPLERSEFPAAEWVPYTPPRQARPEKMSAGRADRRCATEDSAVRAENAERVDAADFSGPTDNLANGSFSPRQRRSGRQYTPPRRQRHGTDEFHQGSADRHHRVDRRLARHALVPLP